MTRTLIKLFVLATILALTSCTTTEVCTNRHSFTTKKGEVTVKKGAYFKVKGKRIFFEHFEGSDHIHHEKCKIENDTIILIHDFYGKIITHKFYNE